MAEQEIFLKTILDLKLRFENPFVACCGHGGKYNFNQFMKCGAKKNPTDGKEIVISNTCKDPSVGYSTKWLMVHFRTHPFHWKWPVMEWTTKITCNNILC
ncbi:gdsl esterase/lipase, partial [Quercus suber]